MNKCDNELLIIDYLGNELRDKESSELNNHLRQCPQCRALLEKYSAIQKNTNNYYSSIEFSDVGPTLSKMAGASHIIRRASVAASIAASFLIGFMIIYQNNDGLEYPSADTDSVYQTVEEPLAVINQSEWNLKLNLLQHKIELIKEELSE